MIAKYWALPGRSQLYVRNLKFLRVVRAQMRNKLLAASRALLSPAWARPKELILERLRRRVVVLGCYMVQTPSGCLHCRSLVLKGNESI